MSDAQYPATPEIPRINVAPSQASFNISVKAFLEKASDHFVSSSDSGLLRVPPSHTFYCGMIDREKSTINGPGIAIIAPDKILEGVFDSSINFGKNCKLTDEEETLIVSGDYESGRFNGLGEITGSDISYRGTIVDDHIAGSGCIKTPTFVYSGEFSDTGKRNGLGELTIGTSRYTGNFAMDLPHGRMKMTTDDPDTGVTTIFEGNFVRGQQHGEGRLIDSRGKEWFVLHEDGELKEKQPYHVKVIKDLKSEIVALRTQCENSCDITCRVCMTEKCNIALLPCGHLAICDKCETRLSREGTRKCPMCRGSYRTIAKVIIPS